MLPFYEVKNVPVHSCLLLATEKEARQFPRRDIVLGFCKHCGFISNVAFDPAVQDYSPSYEDQQCFSPTFNAFARNLTERLIQKYDLREKTIVEIGCGKGDFLLSLCELGPNRGIGIDPAIREDRIQSAAASRVTFIKDYYSERYADYHGDFICCRHTLEHIQPVSEFVWTLRHALSNHLETVVFFELPETMRLWRELAFWDIYYEHCSYFTPGSLARLFRFAWFEVLDLATEFDQQYLLLEAKPTRILSQTPHAREESLEQLANAVQSFSEKCRDKMRWWQTRVQQLARAGKRLAVWGSGSKCVAFMTSLGLDKEIAAVIDINPHRHGKFIPGAAKKIMPPASLQTLRPDVVIVMNPIYRNEIRTMLQQMELVPEMMTV